MKFKPTYLLNRLLSLSLIVTVILTIFMTASGQTSQMQKIFNKNHQTWTSRHIKNYQFTFNWRCFCTPDYVKPVIISVRDGAIDSVKYVDGGVAIDKASYEKYKTVEGLFDMIEDAIKHNAAKIQVTYNRGSGYPSLAFIDYAANIADEEKGFEVKDFKVVKRKKRGDSN